MSDSSLGTEIAKIVFALIGALVVLYLLYYIIRWGIILAVFFGVAWLLYKLMSGSKAELTGDEKVLLDFESKRQKEKPSDPLELRMRELEEMNQQLDKEIEEISKY